LIKAASCYTPQDLYCWQRSAGRDRAHGNAQVDFVVQRGSSIIPIEVKSGVTGAMQSLRLFMKNIFNGVSVLLLRTSSAMRTLMFIRSTLSGIF
jgi:hypothetical protein